MKYIALFFGKLLALLGKMLNRGTSLPGKIALKIYPNLLSQINFPKNVVFITGTNGKTSSTLYIDSICKNSGLKTVSNHEGANMLQGIATTIIINSSFSMNIAADICIFEVDEGTLPTLINYVKPTMVLVSNLFPDQEDRYGSVKSLSEKLGLSLNYPHKLFLNGNDPNSVYLGRLAEDAEKIYFGVSSADLEEDCSEEICPMCSATLHYSGGFYEQLGYFDCFCGFTVPTLNYTADCINLEERSLKINNKAYVLPYDIFYYVFNVLGIVSVCSELKLPIESINSCLESIKTTNGRLEENKHFVMNLVKNAAGLNQTIAYICSKNHSEFNIILDMNLSYADGRDPSWLKNVNFKKLQSAFLNTIYLCGEAAPYLKETLLDSGISESIITEGSEESLIEDLKKSNIKTYILANYSAMYSIKKLL